MRWAAGWTGPGAAQCRSWLVSSSPSMSSRTAGVSTVRAVSGSRRITSTITRAAWWRVGVTRASWAQQAAARRSPSSSMSLTDRPAGSHTRTRSPTGEGRDHSRNGILPSRVIVRDCTKQARIRCRVITLHIRRTMNRRDAGITSRTVVVPSMISNAMCGGSNIGGSSTMTGTASGGSPVLSSGVGVTQVWSWTNTTSRVVMMNSSARARTMNPSTRQKMCCSGRVKNSTVGVRACALLVRPERPDRAPPRERVRAMMDTSHSQALLVGEWEQRWTRGRICGLVTGGPVSTAALRGGIVRTA